MPIDCGALTLFSFKNLVVTIDNRDVTGFWEGDDALEIERPSDLASLMVGADGSGVASISADQSAVVTMRLQPNSPFNDYLTKRAKLMRMGSIRLMTIAVRDTSSGEGGGCSQAFVMKEPDMSFGEEANVREWQIGCLCWQPNDVTYAPVSAA